MFANGRTKVLFFSEVIVNLFESGGYHSAPAETLKSQ